MKALVLLVLFLPNSYPDSTMQSSHGLGLSAATSLNGGVQSAAKATDISQVPGYATSNPQETNLNDQNIGGSTLSKTSTEPVATYIKPKIPKKLITMQKSYIYQGIWNRYYL